MQLLLAVGLMLLVGAILVSQRFNRDMALARVHAAQGSVLVTTRCGPIYYQKAGTGIPLLVVHGSGGGHDQGMAFAAPLAQRGMRVIAMSRFGYLRTHMPVDVASGLTGKFLQELWYREHTMPHHQSLEASHVRARQILCAGTRPQRVLRHLPRSQQLPDVHLLRLPQAHPVQLGRRASGRRHLQF